LRSSGDNRIEIYKRELLRWNERINLIGPEAKTNLDEHIDEALAAAEILRPEGDVLDFGSGILHRVKLADGSSQKVADGFEGGDGLTWDKFGRLFITSWKTGKLWGIPRPGQKPTLLADNFEQAADSCLDITGRNLLVPDMKKGTLTAFPTTIKGWEVDESPLAGLIDEVRVYPRAALQTRHPGALLLQHLWRAIMGNRCFPSNSRKHPGNAWDLSRPHFCGCSYDCGVDHPDAGPRLARPVDPLERRV